jgi:hypothetical protein
MPAEFQRFLPYAIALIAVFAGRAAGRAARTGTAAAAFVPPQMAQSSTTLCVFLILIGYYVCIYCWVLWKSRHPAPEDRQAPKSTTLT